MKTITLLVPFLVLGFVRLTAPQHQGESDGIDKRSYRLGGIGAFSEVVGGGVKKLALSSPMRSQEMDALMDEATKIAARNRVKLHRETDFLVTDLFPASVTEGKHVLRRVRSSVAGRNVLSKIHATPKERSTTS